MTKTITQWLDSLSPRANEIITRALNEYYFYPDKTLTLDIDPDTILQQSLSGDTSALSRFTSRYSGQVRLEVIMPFLTALKFKNEGKISNDDFLKFFDNNIYDDNCDIKLDGVRLTGYLSLEDRRRLLDMPDTRYASRVETFLQKIIKADDFTDFNSTLDGDDLKFFKYNSEIRSEFCTPELIYDYYKRNPSEYTFEIFSRDKTMFDCLFFGNSGWELSDKQEIVKNLFGHYNMNRIHQFFRYVVAVDPYWLHSLDKILRERGLAATVYNLKRSECPIDEDYDADGNRVNPTEIFRFPKHIRKLAMIAHCCNRKSLPKTKNTLIGDVASLVRFYDFNFTNIVDCLYPDNTEPKTLVETTQVAAE